MSVSLKSTDTEHAAARWTARPSFTRERVLLLVSLLFASCQNSGQTNDEGRSSAELVKQSFAAITQPKRCKSWLEDGTSEG